MNKELKQSLETLLVCIRSIEVEGVYADKEFEELHQRGYENLISAESDFSEGLRWIMKAKESIESEICKLNSKETDE